MVKIERTYPAPASLAMELKKQSGSYSEPDVIERLKQDFHNKCYIYELKNLQDPQVEHLLPHKNGRYRDRMFLWENLFWACGHCNGVKNKAEYENDILDCCKDDPEEKIWFRLIGDDVAITAKNGQEVQSIKTAQLIHEVFNLKNTGMRVYRSSMRLNELRKEMNILYDNLEKLKERPDSRAALRKVQALLKRESGFAAFKRCFVREHLEDFPYLKDCI